MFELLLDFHLANLPSAALAGVPLLVNAFILAYVVFRLPRDAVTRAFALFIFFLIAWQLSDMMARLSASPTTALAWRNLLRAPQFLALPTGLLFAMTYADYQRVTSHPVAVGALVIPGVLLAGAFNVDLDTRPLESAPFWGYVYPKGSNPLQTTWVLWNSALSLATLTVLTGHWRRVRHVPNQAHGALLLLVGFTIPTLLSLFFFAVLPLMFNAPQFHLTSTTMVVFSVATVVALDRYGLLTISTPTAAKAMLDLLTDALMIAGPTGQLLYINPTASRMFAIDRDRVSMHRIADLVSPEQADAFEEEILAPTAAGARLEGVELQLRLADGRCVHASISTASVPISRSGAPGIAVIAHDVSALKATEDALLEATAAADASSRAKSLFLANMSHELRTPLNAIIGYAELLSEDLELDGHDGSLHDLQRVQASGRYLLKLINDILDLSKVESGKVELHLETVAVRDVVEEVVVNARELCRRNRNAFIVDLDEAPNIIIDRLRLRQVLLNLLSNAGKFTEDGTVTLSSRVAQRGGQTLVLLVVRDTGVGMTAEQAGSVFRLFSNVRGDAQGAYGGTGLALALSQRLCQRMGGGLEVTSVPGEGTTFTISLPVSD